MSSNCPFCDLDQSRVVFETDTVVCCKDKFPVSKGHALIILRRHVASWFDATIAEQQAVLAAIEKCKDHLETVFQPDGYNIGINIGESAGQTISHVHVHVIPRYENDVFDPRGGVRHVVPEKGNYLESDGHRAQLPKLITGGDDEFLPHFKAAVESAVSVDFAAAFIMQSGVRLLRETLVDLIARGGNARIITGDYLHITDPDALSHLLDLGDQIDLRVFEAKGQSFHPKSYIFHSDNGHKTAFVGSSNLSETALTNGIEWNYRILSSEDGGLPEVIKSFEELYRHSKTKPIDHDWITAYRKRRGKKTVLAPIAILNEAAAEIPEPHTVQKQALLALRQTRLAGNEAGLVVLATGLGKTWLSAFDSASGDFKRILFVAHREEILVQAMHTFRQIRPNAHLGKYTGTEKDLDAEIVFASIQTLGRESHLRNFNKDAFDYIVVDEFHHAAARTYRRLIEHFSPRFLLGLTATPERTDGGDLMAICQDNLVFEKNLADGINTNLLCAFEYFGVPDEVNYENIPWRSSRFDEEELTNAVATTSRAENALEHYRDKAGKRTLGFCCSQRHADFMAHYFEQQNIRAVSVHSGPTSYQRARALEELADGAIDIIFAVDIFNEGLDLPAIDTVLMLRPTQSSIVWLQQFGRGLRKSPLKEQLTVIDYIGNHRSFLVKIRTMLQPLIGSVKSDAEIAIALKQIEKGEIELPLGCAVTYELEAKDIIRGLLRVRANDDAILTYYQDFLDRNGRRPRAGDLFRAGYNPRALRTSHGSWFGFVNTLNGLSAEESSAYTACREFLEALESTPMSKSYKMVVLLAMLNQDRLPGKISLDDLMIEFRRVASRSAILKADVGDVLASDKELCAHLVKNPITAWQGGKGTGGTPYFGFDGRVFEFLPHVAEENRIAFQELLRELVDWRLGEYVTRNNLTKTDQIVCKLLQSGGRPILKLPDREKQEGVPSGWVQVHAEGDQFYAKFSKEFINVIRKKQSDKQNVIGDLMKGWFGPDAGQPGTAFKVAFESFGDSYRLKPLGVVVEGETGITWQHFKRERIPGLFGEEFKQMVWQQGFVPREGQVFLFVTLDKSQHQADHQYNDRFASPTIFKWQSQNRTKQDSKHGRIISEHQEAEIEIRLFVRRQSKLDGKAAPFIYCGEVDFVEWEGEQPISVTWKLRTPVPVTLREQLDVPS